MMNAPQGQEHVVKKSKFTEEQIAFVLKQAALGGGALGNAPEWIHTATERVLAKTHGHGWMFGL